MSSQHEDLRHILRSFATGVTIISTTDSNGLPKGLTVNSFTSVSLDPPLVLFCIDRNADCFPALVNASHFGVNVLASWQKPLSTRFATRSTAKWSGVAYDKGKSGVPLLGGCLAHLECAKDSSHSGGDHIIMVGRVLRAYRGNSEEPLIFFAGQYSTLNGMRTARSSAE